MGGPYDIINFPELIEVINKEKIPYFLIQQFNFENLVLSNQVRRTAKEIFTKAEKIYFISERNKETTERNLVTKLTNFKIVSNPANLMDYDAPLFPYTNGNYRFANVARLEAAYKGQDMLLQVLSSEKWKSRNWELNFYGSGPSYEYIIDLIDFYQLNNKVFLKGSVSNIKEIWAENHLLVMPSVAEGTPLALIEAMICARPSVVTDVGGNGFLIDDNINGFIAVNNSKAMLNDAMERAWHEKDLWKQLGESARDAVLTKINLTSYIDNYNEIIFS
jgi:glycosyltransferase involved in cell wall biosynthesis